MSKVSREKKKAKQQKPSQTQSGQASAAISPKSQTQNVKKEAQG